MDKSSRFVAAVLFAPLVYSFVYEAWLFLLANRQSELLRAFATGLLVYFAVHIVVSQQNMEFVQILVHELRHAFVGCTMLFWTVQFLIVDPESRLLSGSKGIVSFEDGDWSALVALAPYSFPVPTVGLLAIHPFAPPSVRSAVDFLIGLTLAFHYTTIMKELHLRQSDLTKTGVLFSISAILLVNAVFLVVVLSVLLGSYESIPEYFGRAWERTPASYATAIYLLKALGAALQGVLP